MLFARKKYSIVLLALLVGASVMSIRQSSLATSEIHASIGQHVTLDFTVVTDPKKIKNGKISLIAKARGVPVRVIGFGDEYLPSARFRATGKLLASKEPRVAALFISWKKFRSIDEATWWQQKLGNVRKGLREAAESEPLIPGMVLGDTSLQSVEFSDAMRRSGLTHLTAVSGANFAIISSFLLWLMQFPIRKVRARLLVTSIFLVAFIGLVRPSPSVLRAAAMAAVVIFAKSHRSQSHSIPSLGFAIAIVVIADPWQSRDPGFALSVLATAGLLLIAPKLRLPKGFAEPIAATILCSPIIVALSGYLSITSIFANVLAAPLVAPVTILGFVAALLPPLAPFLVALAKIPAGLITKIAFKAADFPVIQLKSALIILMLGGALFLGRRYLILLLPLLLLITYLQRWPNNDWQIANCDVGQGDALVLKVAPKSAVVIDTGPEPKLIDQCLKSLSISQIPLLIITHPHADHIGGLSGALPNRKVGRVLQSATRGEVLQVGDMRIEILWPDGASHSFADTGGEGSAINNQSIVALITTSTYKLLATGDAEPDVQGLLTPPKVDYLKVAHHGSKYQDPRFNALADPTIAIISVGAGNKYGHPADRTVKLFKKVLRTDKNGAIAIDPITGSVSSSKVGAFGLPVLWRVA
jgi:competence protein ComEC